MLDNQLDSAVVRKSSETPRQIYSSSQSHSSSIEVNLQSPTKNELSAQNLISDSIQQAFAMSFLSSNEKYKKNSLQQAQVVFQKQLPKLIKKHSTKETGNQRIQGLYLFGLLDEEFKCQLKYPDNQEPSYLLNANQICFPSQIKLSAIKLQHKNKQIQRSHPLFASNLVQKKPGISDYNSLTQRAPYNPLNVSGRQSPILKRSSNNVNQRATARHTNQPNRPTTPNLKKETQIRSFVQVNPLDLEILETLMKCKLERRQTSTATTIFINLADVLQHYRIVNYTYTTFEGELRYACYLVFWHIQSNESEEIVISPKVLCLLMHDALFNFSESLLKHLQTHCVQPLQLNLLIQMQDYQVLPFEFYVWLTFKFFNNMTTRIQIFDNIRLYSQQSDDQGKFLLPNLNFQILKVFDRSQLIQLFCCLLLEYKLCFILQDEQKSCITQVDIPNLFECLLQLIEPIDKHIFTQVPFFYTEEMCTLLQKPGSLLCSITQDLWYSKGKSIFEQDPEYTLLIFVGESITLFNEELPRFPQMIEVLLFDSLITDNMTPIQHQITLKQAFYNGLLLTCMMVKMDEDNEFLSEFSLTTCYINLLERAKNDLLPDFAQNLNVLEREDQDEVFQRLIDEQGKTISDQLQELTLAENEKDNFPYEKVQKLKELHQKQVFDVNKNTLQGIKQLFSSHNTKNQNISKQPRKIQDSIFRKPKTAKKSSIKLPIAGDQAIKEQPSKKEQPIVQQENRSFFTMVTEFFTGVITQQPKLAQKQQLPSQYSDTEIQSQPSHQNTEGSDETQKNVASEGKGRIRIELGRPIESIEVMPFKFAKDQETDVSKSQTFSVAQKQDKPLSSTLRQNSQTLFEMPTKFPSTLSFRQLPANTIKIAATKPRQKNAKVIKKTNINLQLMKANSLNSFKNEGEQTLKQDTTALRLQQIIKRATLNQTAQLPQNSLQPRNSLASQSKTTKDDMKTPPKQFKARKQETTAERIRLSNALENIVLNNSLALQHHTQIQDQPESIEQNQATSNKKSHYNPQVSLSPKMINSGQSFKQNNTGGQRFLIRPKAFSQFIKKEKPSIGNVTTTAAKVIKLKQMQPVASAFVLQKIKRLENRKQSERQEEVLETDRQRSTSKKVIKETILSKQQVKFVQLDKTTPRERETKPIYQLGKVFNNSKM